MGTSKALAYMCTLVARHIDKVGGLDNYILNVPKQKQQSDLAQQLRQRIEAALQKPLRDALKANSEVRALSLLQAAGLLPSVYHLVLPELQESSLPCPSCAPHL